MSKLNENEPDTRILQNSCLMQLSKLNENEPTSKQLSYICRGKFAVLNVLVTDLIFLNGDFCRRQRILLRDTCTL